MSQDNIKQLPTTTRAKLRSTQILTSLPQIVSELLQNSLDASARQIEIGVDCAEWTCWVKDNGSGISKDGLAVISSGSDNGRYGSSKAYTPDTLNSLSTFGFRGEALASAADLCCLEISSRTSRSRDTWSIILKGGKCLFNGPAVRWRRESAGTVVCVRDAFYNLPVRRHSHPSPAKTFELIRQEIETYALVFPQVSFTLENTHTEGANANLKDPMLRIPKTPSTLDTFRHLFGRALTNHVEPIDVQSGALQLEGFISLDGAQTKAYQFLYVNRHPLSTCDLHKAIEAQVSSSSFARHAYDEDGDPDPSRLATRRSPRKSMKKLAYVLNLTIPPQEIDNCLEPAKAVLQFQNKQAVEAFLFSTIQSFLVRHGFATPPSLKRSDGTPSPKKRRKLDFDDSGYAEDPEFAFVPEGEEQDAGNQDLFIRQDANLPEDLEEDIVWTDPKTKERFIVDARTGNSRRSDPTSIARELQETKSSTVFRRTLTSFAQPNGKVSEKGPVPNWIQEALQANAVFKQTERKIPSVTLPSTFNEAPHSVNEGFHSKGHNCHSYNDYLRQKEQQRVFLSRHEGSSISTRYRFSKSELSRAKVIQQVDRKFIACLIECEAKDKLGLKPVLVLIDQHAADERVRVEKYLKALCKGFLHNVRGSTDPKGSLKTRDLSPGVPILLTTQEVLRLSESPDVQVAFSNWGFRFEGLAQTENDATFGHRGEDSNGYAQVIARSLPEVVSDKLLLGNELRDLVKGFLAKLESDMPCTMAEEDESDFGWLKALRWCPQELLDLVNSKACRGAIMFNDTLTLAQQVKLVKQLAETAFPFQCAHGRPSLVPLTNLGNLSSGTEGRKGIDWSRL